MCEVVVVGGGEGKGPVMTTGRTGGVAELHPLLLPHPTFMPAQGALLTTNKSTARSNLSRRSVGRGSGVWGERGRKGKEKKVEMKGEGGGEKDRKSDKEGG